MKNHRIFFAIFQKLQKNCGLTCILSSGGTPNMACLGKKNSGQCYLHSNKRASTAIRGAAKSLVLILLYFSVSAYLPVYGLSNVKIFCECSSHPRLRCKLEKMNVGPKTESMRTARREQAQQEEVQQSTQCLSCFIFLSLPACLSGLWKYFVDAPSKTKSMHSKYTLFCHHNFSTVFKPLDGSLAKIAENLQNVKSLPYWKNAQVTVIVWLTSLLVDT